MSPLFYDPLTWSIGVVKDYVSQREVGGEDVRQKKQSYH